MLALLDKINRASLRQVMLVVALVSLLPFLGVLNAEFVWDDGTLQKEQIPSWNSLSDIADSENNQTSWIFRPVPALSYLFDEKLNQMLVDGDGPAKRMSPQRARIPHATSLALHGLTAGAVTALAFGLGLAPLWAGVAGLFFGLHPIHVENVSWVAARADTLSTLFVLLCAVFALGAKITGEPWRLAAGGACFLFALFSKEVALSGLVIVPLALWVGPSGANEKPWARPWAVFGGLLALCLLYLSVRGARGMGGEGYIPPDFVLLVKQSLSAASFYVRKILFPWPHNPFVPKFPGFVPTFSWLAVGLAILAAAVWTFRRGTKFYIFCALWFLASIGPSLAVAFKTLTVSLLAERYLYLPSVALALGAAWFGAGLNLESAKKIYFGCLSALLLVFGVSATSASLCWSDNMTLMTRMTELEVSADNPLPWTNIGFQYYKRKEFDKAWEAFTKAVSLRGYADSHSVATAYEGLGRVGFQRAEETMALRDFPKALEINKTAQGNMLKSVELEPEGHIPRAWLGLLIMQGLILDKELSGNFDEVLFQEAGAQISFAFHVDPQNDDVSFAKFMYEKMGGKIPSR